MLFVLWTLVVSDFNEALPCSIDYILAVHYVYNKIWQMAGTKMKDSLDWDMS